MPWRSRPELWGEGIRVADLRTKSPPLAIAPERTVQTNDPKATATYGRREPVASFEFSGWARHSHRVGQSRLPKMTLPRRSRAFPYGRGRVMPH